MEFLYPVSWQWDESLLQLGFNKAIHGHDESVFALARLEVELGVIAEVIEHFGDALLPEVQEPDFVLHLLGDKGILLAVDFVLGFRGFQLHFLFRSFLLEKVGIALFLGLQLLPYLLNLKLFRLLIGLVVQHLLVARDV